jgi:superfamily II DNA or RNA helicase
MKLRQYQETAKIEVRALFRKGHKRVIMCKPTGSGKTFTFASIASDAVKLGSRVAILVDRKELLEQAASKLKAYGLRPQIIRGNNRINYQSQAFVATVQTLINRPQPDLNLLVIDEAHKQTFDKLLDLPAYKNTYVIGATATPMRSGKMKQLSDNYTALVEPVTISELIGDGFLVPAFTYAAKKGVADLSEVKTSLGDFDKKAMFDAFNKTPLYDGVVEKYREFADGDRAICFNINVEHSEKTTAAFDAAGVRAKHCDGGMSEKEREQILRDWRLGLFDVLCNCDLFTTGFDEPTIETVIVNRATQSVPLWLQMCGRGSRPSSGKSEFKIIDMGANVYRLGLWEQERKFSLTHENRKTKGEAPVKECDPTVGDSRGRFGCGAVVHASASTCKSCGFIFPIKERALIVGDFGQVTDKNSALPEYLANKKFKEMSIAELDEVREIRKYNLGWLIRQVATRNDLSLEELQEFKGYKKSWVVTTKERLGLNVKQ